MHLQNGIWVWSINPSKYVHEAVRICKEYNARHLSKNYRLPKRADNLFKNVYSPGLDVSQIGTRGGILLPALDRSIEMDDQDRAN